MAFRRQHVIGVQPHDPIPRGHRNGRIARGGKIVTPLEETHLCPVLLRHADGAVIRARIDDDYLID